MRSGKAKEYLGPLEKLSENMSKRSEVTVKLRDFRLVNMKNKYEAEELAARQNHQVFIVFYAVLITLFHCVCFAFFYLYG